MKSDLETVDNVELYRYRWGWFNAWIRRSSKDLLATKAKAVISRTIVCLGRVSTGGFLQRRLE